MESNRNGFMIFARLRLALRFHLEPSTFVVERKPRSPRPLFNNVRTALENFDGVATSDFFNNRPLVSFAALQRQRSLSSQLQTSANPARPL